MVGSSGRATNCRMYPARPSRLIAPVALGSSPAITFNSVVFPMPLAPTSAA